MQQRRGSEKKTRSDADDSGDSVTASAAAGAATVKLRGKDKSPGGLVPPLLRLVNRPYSCDIESLSPSPINPIQPQQHHPYFYNHQAAVRQHSVAANGANGPLISARRLNASYQQLTSVVDDEGAEDDFQARHGRREAPKQPPMAVQEDFVLEPSEQAVRKTSANGNHCASGSVAVRVQQKPVNYYVNLPSTPSRGQKLQPSQSVESANGYSIMQRSASQCDFQHQADSDRLPGPAAMAHQRLQHQRSAANSYYYTNAGSDSNVSLSKPPLALSANASGADQMECLSSDYYPRSPTFGAIQNQQRRQLSGDGVTRLIGSSSNSSSAPYFSSATAFSAAGGNGTTARDYGSASSIDRLAPPRSSGATVGEAFQRPQAANTSCAAPSSASSVVSKQQKQNSLPLRNSAANSSGLRAQQNFVVSVTSVDDDRPTQTTSLDSARQDRAPLTKTASQVSRFYQYALIPF